MSKPVQLRFDKHKSFINAQNINPDTIDYLRRLNAIAAVGLENFALIDFVGKGSTTVFDNLNALRQLRDASVPASLSMVLGIPGETKSTLEENSDWIDFIFQEYSTIIDQFLISPLIVTTGSKAYHELMALPDMQKKYKNLQLPFDIFEMSKDYFHNFCQVSRQETLEHIIRLNERIKKQVPSVIVSGHVHHTEVQIKGLSK